MYTYAAQKKKSPEPNRKYEPHHIRLQNSILQEKSNMEDISTGHHTASHQGKTLLRKTVLTSHDAVNAPRQFALDNFDLRPLRESGIDNNILNEFNQTYGNNQGGINYRDNNQGGQAYINGGIFGANIANRSFFLRRWFNDRNRTNDIIRQSQIIHEVTHLSVATANRHAHPELNFVNPNIIELEADMAPAIALDEINQNIGNIVDSHMQNEAVLREFRHNFGRSNGLQTNDLFDWIGSRILYMATNLPREYPSVINELYYLLHMLDNGRFQNTTLYLLLNNLAVAQQQARAAQIPAQPQ